MATKIQRNEFHFVEVGHDAIIQTCVPRELLDDPNMYMPHIRGMKLALGTMLRVQVLNEEKNKLLYETSFRITAAVETHIGQDDDYGSRVRPQTNYQIERMTDWWSSKFGIESEVERATRDSVALLNSDPEVNSQSQGDVKWNPGKKLFEVIVDGAVVGSERDKGRALALASATVGVAT